MLFRLITRDTESVLRIEGELDVLSAPDLRPAIDRIAAGRYRHVLVDLSDLRLIDSVGVGAIVSLFKAVRSYGGKMVVSGAREQPLAILRLLNLDRVLAGQSASDAEAHLASAAPIGSVVGTCLQASP